MHFADEAEVEIRVNSFGFNDDSLDSNTIILGVGIALIAASIILGFVSCCISSRADSNGGSRQAWCASAIIFVAFVCLFGGAFLSLRAVQVQKMNLEAHSMKSGTPDCARSAAVCGNVSMRADMVENLGADGGADVDKQVCCRDLMLRMLVDIAGFLDKHDVEWYITYGTLLGAVRNKSIIPWTDDIDIIIPSKQDQELLRAQAEIPYRFGRYGNIMRGAANYPGVSKKLPHHSSGPSAHMWINDWLPWVPMVTCEGEGCVGRQDPEGRQVQRKDSQVFPDWTFSGRTAYYFADIYAGNAANMNACDALGKSGGYEGAHGVKSPVGQRTRSRKTVEIAGQQFPVHHNVNACLEEWYGPNWMTPIHEHVSDYWEAS